VVVLGGGPVAEGAVRPVGVVRGPPPFGQDAGFGKCTEQFDVEVFVTDPAVERLNERVLPRRAGLDVHGPNTRGSTPVPKHVSGELGPVVHAEMNRCTVDRDQCLEDSDKVLGGGRAGHVHGQRFAGVLVDDVSQLEPAAIAGLIELEIDCPHITRPRRSEQFGAWVGSAAFAAAWRRAAEPFFTPQAPCPLGVDDHPFVAEQAVSEFPTPPGLVPGDVSQPCPQELFGICGRRGWASLTRTVLTQHLAGEAFGDPVSFHRRGHCSAATVRGQKFPSAASFKIDFATSASARRRFRRAFSTSSSFSRLASGAFMPPYW
jgi:hypothetical protein